LLKFGVLRRGGRS